MSELPQIWVYLSASPLFHLTLTLAAYQAGLWIYRRSGLHPLLNPVLLAVLMVAAVLTVSRTPYVDYFEGAQFVHFLLGPATVALAIPLYRQLARVRASWLAILSSIATGSAVAAGSAAGIAYLAGSPAGVIASLAPKSVTAPVAMGIAEQIGGLPSLTAVLVIVTGIIGAMLGPAVLDALGIRDWRARGLAIGTASHGIGTARAFQVNEVAGAFAGLAMGINAIATALLLPIVWGLLG
ncbi:MAG: LrgB family protein [Rhizobiales bacterium]|nr:LrgB family protein [Hyphomicrobiales bacterium]